MARKSSQSKSVFKYLLFTVIVLLVTVSLLSLFVFKYTNLVSDNVLGASIKAPPATLLCGVCPGSIILQKDGTNPKNWGAKCVTPQAFKTSTYVAYLTCPTAAPTPRITCIPRPTCVPKAGTACPMYVGENICPPAKPSPVLTPYLRPTLPPHTGQTSH
jgi:hypothetical protein